MGIFSRPEGGPALQPKKCVFFDLINLILIKEEDGGRFTPRAPYKRGSLYNARSLINARPLINMRPLEVTYRGTPGGPKIILSCHFLELITS